MMKSVLYNQILSVLQGKEKDHSFTQNIHLANIAMHHAQICDLIQIQLKLKTNHSDIFLIKVHIMKSPPDLVRSTARDQLAVPEGQFKRK